MEDGSLISTMNFSFSLAFRMFSFSAWWFRRVTGGGGLPCPFFFQNYKKCFDFGGKM